MLRRGVPGTESVVRIIFQRFLTATTCNTTTRVAFPGTFLFKETTKNSLFQISRTSYGFGKITERDEKLILLTNYSAISHVSCNHHPKGSKRSFLVIISIRFMHGQRVSFIFFLSFNSKTQLEISLFYGFNRFLGRSLSAPPFL